MIGTCWLLLSGSLEQTQINWDVLGAVERRLGGHLLCERHRVRRFGVLIMLNDLCQAG